MVYSRWEKTMTEKVAYVLAALCFTTEGATRAQAGAHRDAIPILVLPPSSDWAPEESVEGLVRSCGEKVGPGVWVSVERVNARGSPELEAALDGIESQYDVSVHAEEFKRHARAWERALEMGLPHTLILDGNAHCERRLCQQLHQVLSATQTTDWPIVYLGGQLRRDFEMRGDLYEIERPGIARHRFVDRLLWYSREPHAYVISAAQIRMLLGEISHARQAVGDNMPTARVYMRTVLDAGKATVRSAHPLLCHVPLQTHLFAQGRRRRGVIRPDDPWIARATKDSEDHPGDHPISPPWAYIQSVPRLRDRAEKVLKILQSQSPSLAHRTVIHTEAGYDRTVLRFDPDLRKRTLLHHIRDDRKKLTIVGNMLNLLDAFRDIARTDPVELAENDGFAFVFEDDVRFADPEWLDKFRALEKPDDCAFVWLNAIYPNGEIALKRTAARVISGEQRSPDQRLKSTSFHFHTAEAIAVTPAMAQKLHEFNWDRLQATDVGIMDYEIFTGGAGFYELQPGVAFQANRDDTSVLTGAEREEQRIYESKAVTKLKKKEYQSERPHTHPTPRKNRDGL